MTVFGERKGFKHSSAEMVAESLIYQAVCARDSIKSATELKALWDLDEPLAGLETQVLWLPEGLEGAKKIISAIAPHSRVGDSQSLTSRGRPIVVFHEATRPNANLLKRVSQDPILIALVRQNEREGVVAIESPGARSAADAIHLRAPGTAFDVGAATAAVVAALLTKWPSAKLTDVQRTLLAAAIKGHGTPELRRVRQNFRPIWNSFEVLEVFEPGFPVERHLRCTSGTGAKLKFEVLQGTLPPGLRLDPTGLIKGTPLPGHSSIHSVIIRATNDVDSTDREVKFIVGDAGKRAWDRFRKK